MYVFIFLVKFMFSWYKYLIVNLVFSHLGFWSGNLFLIAPFPDLCLLVLFLNCIQVMYCHPESTYTLTRFTESLLSY